VHVPLVLMDSVQRRVVADARRRKVTQYDPFGRVRSTFEEEEEDAALTDAQLAMHKPGYRFSTGASALHAKLRAYDEGVREMCNAWRKCDASPPGAYPLSAGEGTACTINGAPGTLQRRGDWLACVPDNDRIDFDAASTVPRMTDEASAQAIRDAAYLRMCNELINAWRTK